MARARRAGASALCLILLLRSPATTSIGRRSASISMLREALPVCPATMTLRGGKPRRERRNTASTGHTGMERPRRKTVLALRQQRKDQRKDQNGGSRASAEQAGEGAGLRHQLQHKLDAIKSRRSILDDYESKYAQAEQIANPSLGLETSTGHETAAESDSGSGDHREARIGQRVDGEQTGDDQAIPEAGKDSVDIGDETARSPDSLLRELQREGLCTLEELDARVRAFIVTLKKDGRRAALVGALSEFGKQLRGGRRMRNRNAVLTKILREHVRAAAAPTAPAGGGGSARPVGWAWASDLSFQVTDSAAHATLALHAARVGNRRSACADRAREKMRQARASFCEMS